MFPIATDRWIKAFKPQLAERGVLYDLLKLDADDASAGTLSDALSSRRYTCIVILQLAAGGSVDHDNLVFQNAHALAEWTAAGGVLCINGEGLQLSNLLAAHFGKAWNMCSYLRTAHQLNSSHGVASKAAGLPVGCNVKAQMVDNVPKQEQLYAATGSGKSQSMVFEAKTVDAGKCAVALGGHGKGHVLFFGDVNAEEASVTIVLEVGLSVVADGGLAGGGLAGGSSAGGGSASKDVSRCCASGCSEAGVNRCAQCKIAKYCSRGCQKSDWTGHKKQCLKKQGEGGLPRQHCVRCHQSFASTAGCKVRGGRDTDMMGRPGSGVHEVCQQCPRQHSLKEQPFCFQGEHTTDPEAACWGASDESDPLDYPAPQCERCGECNEKIWESSGGL